MVSKGKGIEMNTITKVKKKVYKTGTAVCVICNKQFAIANWRVGKAKYCGYICYNERRKSTKSYDKPRTCVGCGNDFLPTQWYQKYCARSCFSKSVKKRKVINCKECSKEFEQTRIEQKYCSRKCSTPYKDKTLRKPKYVSLDDTWSKAVKERVGYKCEYCGKTETLNSHHIFSRSNKKVRWDMDNGICLCVLHHVFGIFSAHKSPLEFGEWLKETRGIDWYERLREKAKLNTTVKYTKPNKAEEQIIREELKAYFNKKLLA